MIMKKQKTISKHSSSNKEWHIQVEGKYNAFTISKDFYEYIKPQLLQNNRIAIIKLKYENAFVIVVGQEIYAEDTPQLLYNEKLKTYGFTPKYPTAARVLYELGINEDNATFTLKEHKANNITYYLMVKM